MLICFIGVMKMLNAYNKVTCITKHYHGPTRFILHAFHYTSFDKLHGALWVPPHGFHLFELVNITRKDPNFEMVPQTPGFFPIYHVEK